MKVMLRKKILRVAYVFQKVLPDLLSLELQN